MFPFFDPNERYFELFGGGFETFISRALLFYFY